MICCVVRVLLIVLVRLAMEDVGLVVYVYFICCVLLWFVLWRAAGWLALFS